MIGWKLSHLYISLGLSLTNPLDLSINKGLDRASFELDDIVSKARLDFDLQQTKYRYK